MCLAGGAESLTFTWYLPAFESTLKASQQFLINPDLVKPSPRSLSFHHSRYVEIICSPGVQAYCMPGLLTDREKAHFS